MNSPLPAHGERVPKAGEGLSLAPEGGAPLIRLRHLLPRAAGEKENSSC